MWTILGILLILGGLAVLVAFIYCLVQWRDVDIQARDEKALDDFLKIDP